MELLQFERAMKEAQMCSLLFPAPPENNNAVRGGARADTKTFGHRSQRSAGLVHGYAVQCTKLRPLAVAKVTRHVYTKELLRFRVTSIGT